MDYRERGEERIRLKRAIDEWNASRLDLFEITEPDEYLEFFGVMRFFFQEENDKVSTKCVRVSSTATTSDVINILIEKFHPDMRMLTIPEYTLYEVHANGEERQVEGNERPLYVQLNWTTDLREGRFLLKKKSDRTALGFFEVDQNNQNFKRKLSKREKKEQKKKEKQAKLKAKEEGTSGEKLYHDLSKSRFTRTISNPDVVMRRRRQQKLDQMKKFQNRPDSGGTLKIYAHSVFPEVPYKTLLVSVDETCDEIIMESLEKFGKEKANPDEYVLVKVVVPPGEDPNEYSKRGDWGKEAIMDGDESPLGDVMRWPESRGELIFELKKKPEDYQPRNKRRGQQGKKDPRSPNGQPGWYNDPSKVPQDRLPYFLELNNDGTDVIDYKPKRHRLQVNVTEVGSEREVSNNGQYLQLFPGILPRHCVVANMEGVVTITPTSPEAETYVNNQRIYETTMLQHSSVVRFGRHHTFRFCDPQDEDPDYPSNKRNRENFETTFDANGTIESTVTQDVLPAKLEFRESNEDQFLSAIVSEVDGQHVHFRLAPAYTLYLASRFRLSKMYRPEMGPTERAQRLTAFLNKIADLVDRTAQQDNFQTASSLGFWLANGSEILHFIQHDQDLGGISQDAQDILQECIKDTFMNLSRAMNQELKPALMAFFDPTTEADVEKEEDNVSLDSWQSGFSQRWLNPQGGGRRGKPTISDVCHIFLSAMTLLRRCRVNAALTIQIFSQLFHYINAFIFNKFINPQNAQNCTRQWASRIYKRLGRLGAWAEKQGLEHAAETHLAQINQTFLLMLSSKKSKDEVLSASNQCFKLNSRQIGQVLRNTQPDKTDRPVPPAWIEKAVNQAAATNDPSFGPTHSLPLEEELELRLAFVIPEDGYSCDNTKGLPNGFQEFLDPLARAGMVRLTPQPMASGVWTVHMYGQRPKSPESSPTSTEVSLACVLPWAQGFVGMVRLTPQPMASGVWTVHMYGQRPKSPESSPTSTEVSLACVLPWAQGFVGMVRLTPQPMASGVWTVHMYGQRPKSPESSPTSTEVSLACVLPWAQGFVGMVRLTPQPMASGVWTVHMYGQRPKSPESSPTSTEPPAPKQDEPLETFTMTLNKNGARGMGLSIIAAKGVGQEKVGVYVKQVVPGGAAEKDGRLMAGDQLLEVDANFLVGITQEGAAEALMNTGQIVHLKVAKKGAIKHGLAELLVQTEMPQVNKVAELEQNQTNHQSKTDSMERPVPAPRNLRAGMPGYQGLQNADKARSSPNLAEEPPSGMPDHYSTLPRERTSSTSDMKPQQHNHRGMGVRVLPNNIPMSQRSKSTSNLEPNMDDRQMAPSRSIGNLPANRQGPPPGDYRSANYGDPYRRDQRPPPQRHEWSDGSDRGSIGQGKDAPDLENFEREPYQRRVPKPSDSYGPGPQQRGPPNQRASPIDPRGTPPDRRGPPPDHRGPPHDHRGPPPDHRGPPPDHRGPPPDHRGPPPDHRGPPPDHRGPPPDHRGPPPDHRGPPPDHRGPPPDHRGPPPDHRGPPPGHRGMPPDQRGPDPRGMPPDHRGLDPRGMPVDQRGIPYDPRDPRAQPPNRYFDQPPPRSQPQSQQMRDHPPMYSPQDPHMQRYPGGPPQGSPYGPPQGSPYGTPPPGSPYGAPPGQRPPVSTYDEPGIIPSQQQHAYASAPAPQQQPPLETSFHEDPDDLPPPPTELPPEPPREARGYPEELPPPPAQNDPRTGSLPRRSEAMEQYQNWHEQEKARLQQEHQQRLLEKQKLEEQQIQPQMDRPQYASLPRQSRISKPSGESPHPTLQRQNSVPKAVPAPKAPERTAASQELTGPRQDAYNQQPPRQDGYNQQPPRQSFEAPQRSMPQGPQYSGPDGMIQELRSQLKPPMETDIDDASPTSPSPWERDLADKKEQLEEERLKRIRDLEIAELSQQPYLNPQQQDRMRKLRMEQEFQRRLEESQMYGDEDDDDDVNPAATEKILRNLQEEEEAKRIREQNEKDYQRQLAMQQQRQEMAMKERQEERLQRLQTELASQRAREQDDHMRYPPPPATWQDEHNNYNRQLDNDMALRHQEEEMARRHEQQRLEYMRREAELEQERRRLEEQLSLRGSQQPAPQPSNVVHTRVNAGYVPAPEKTYITEPPMPVEQAPVNHGVQRPKEQPPPPPISSAPPQNRSNNLPRPKPELKPKPKPPPVAPKKVTLNNRNNNARSATLPQGYKPPTSQYSNTNYANSHQTPNSHAPNSYNQTPTSQSTTNSNMYGTPDNSQGLNSYRTGDTPGVIGAQEVYRDPRDRILANKHHDEPTSPPQQLLSFKDKMKKFSGVTPEQKVRTSKWEREFLAHNPELAD
ncbi:LOW QUALITY PROTEIN: uncharacterized protein [Amphiura filiformis]|uniref:LOW QUALITY PROTEIN: uncharacterized protein n=1 Tax=Amphiura filiformis TaxID=82378 RepID=UPI003B225643